MEKIKTLNVFYHERKVGTLALYKKHFSVFEYDKSWLADGFSLSPFSLPLKQNRDCVGGTLNVYQRT